MLRLEISLDEGLERLKSRVHELGVDYDESDDLDSIASNSTVNAVQSTRSTRAVRFRAASRQVETLQSKLSKMTIENQLLRREVDELRRLAHMNDTEGTQVSEEKKNDDKDSSSIVLTEGNVFNLARGIKNID
ncbi:MAG: regulator of replication initiation timing [Bacillariaceae sp.]|jgi:regulator of replication initiation timing